MEDILDHFEAASGDPKAVVCTTCHTKLPILQNHLKTSKHMRALSKLRCETYIYIMLIETKRPGA